MNEEKLEFLKSAGFSDEDIEALRPHMQGFAKDGEDREQKEADPPEDAEEAAEEEPAEDKERTVKAGELVELIKQVVVPISDVIKEMSGQVDSLQKEVADLKKSDAEKIADTKEATPAASLQELLKQSLIGGDNAASLDGRTSLAKSGPKENEFTPPSVTGIPGLDKMMRAGGAE